MAECSHASLDLWSGGYYLACRRCHKRWVAIHTEGNDHNTDHDPRFSNLSVPDHEYVLVLRERDGA